MRACAAARTRYSAPAVVDSHEPPPLTRPNVDSRARRAVASIVDHLTALVLPDRGVPPLVAAGRFRLAMLLVVIAAAISATAIGARIDVAPTVRAESAGPPPSGGPSEGGEVKTDRDIEEEVAKRTAVIRVKLGFAALGGTPIKIVVIGIALFLLGRYVGGAPTLIGSLTAAAVGALPWAVRSLIAGAAAWRQTAILPDDLDRLVAARFPGELNHVLLTRLSGAVDLFSLWSLVLCGFGLAAAAGIGRARSFAAVTVVYVLFLLISTAGA